MSVGPYMMFLLLFNVSGTNKGNVLQTDSFVMAQEGDFVILPCFHSKKETSMTYWYKQLIGQKPLLMTSSYYHTLPFSFHNGFDKAGRFHLSRAADSTNLTITKLESSDAAVYYCAGSFSNVVIFGAGTALILKGKKIHNNYAVVQQNTLQHMLPESGDSVTLQCSFFTKGCAGEHSVYWFRHDSGESHPGIIYAHGGSSGQCNKSSENDLSTQSCVYSLPKRNLSNTDAGTYLCAVAMCGEILFGNGTKVDLRDELDTRHVDVMTVLAVLLFISLIINFILCLKFRKKDRSSHHITASYKDTGLSEQKQMTDEMSCVNYAALSFPTKKTRERRVRHHEETLYAGLACENQI